MRKAADNIEWAQCTSRDLLPMVSDGTIGAAETYSRWSRMGQLYFQEMLPMVSYGPITAAK